MSFSKSDLENIKNKLSISNEIEKKSRLIKKGNDYWCCCLFHEEKTPSMKINNELKSFYCFGCGAKGDIFTIYTDLYNYTFNDAVNELANQAGIELKKISSANFEKFNKVKEILKISAEWFQHNLSLKESSKCREYLKNRKISNKTIEKFKLGFSYNSNSSLYDYLISKSFSKDDILKSNLVKLDNNNNLRDFFYKRLIFPIADERSSVVGFGGRSLDGSNPKYINSPESNFFLKRQILYNLSEAKTSIRKKNNLLVCEGYMDVVSLYEHGIESVVSTLGTAVTEQQLFLAWKYCLKPTVMLDGDSAGLRAAYKTALMSLSFISAKKLLQFIELPENEDPDSFINNYSKEEFIKILKNPQNLVYFIFNQASLAHSIDSADNKMIFDKYIDEIIDMIKDQKTKYFYKNEFKSLFFDKIRNKKNKPFLKESNYDVKNSSLFNKQINSFFAAFINHFSIRGEIIEELRKTELFEGFFSQLLNKISSPSLVDKTLEEILEAINDKKLKEVLKNCLKSDIYHLFPYASVNYPKDKVLIEIRESCNNLNSRLSYLKKINKSMNRFIENSNQLNWEELQKINQEIDTEYK